jgi:hypothetical protein
MSMIAASEKEAVSSGFVQALVLVLISATLSGCKEDAAANPGDAALASDASVTADVIAAVDGSPSAQGDADVEAKVPVTAIASWPGGLPPGYSAGLCRLRDTWHTSRSCQVGVDCDGASKWVMCERIAASYACSCINSDVGNSHVVPLPQATFGGAGLEPCIAAFEACTND